MSGFQKHLGELLIWIQFLCAIVAMIQYKKVKNSYWKWFVYYILFIFIVEAISKWGLINHVGFRKYFYDFFVIPLEFLFFYWLYAYQSLRLKKLFWISIGIYIISFVPHLLFIEKMRLINALSYTVGNFLLMIMVFLEFYKQIQTDNILLFKENRMFYVNVGVMLFYVGTLPFFAFDNFLFTEARNIWFHYYTFFLIANNLMYLLFTAALLWGKPST
jgi:hypothetical protein